MGHQSRQFSTLWCTQKRVAWSPTLMLLFDVHDGDIWPMEGSGVACWPQLVLALLSGSCTHANDPVRNRNVKHTIDSVFSPGIHRCCYTLDAEFTEDDPSAKSLLFTPTADPALGHRTEPYSPGEVRGNSSIQNRQTPAQWIHQTPENGQGHNGRTNDST